MVLSTRARRPGRFVLLVLAVSFAASFVSASRPTQGAAAEPAESAVPSASPLVEPAAEVSPAPVEPTVMPVDPSVMPVEPTVMPVDSSSEVPSEAPAAPPVEPPSAPPAEPPAAEPPVVPVAPSPDAVVAVVPPSPAPTEAPLPVARTPYPSHCVGWGPVRERADLLVANMFKINVHPTVPIAPDPSWTENPLKDANWEYQFHSQWLVLSLLQSWHETDDVRYRDRAAFLLSDWWTDNPREAPRSAVAWDPMGTALRAQVLACASRYLPMDQWLVSALDGHGRTLADEAFYAKQGNWALNQNLGLLEIGVALARPEWTTLAAQRLAVLFEASVDSQGVTNEQSVYYQYYNWDRYRVAFSRLEAAGLPLPPSASRLGLMPSFLGYATLPNGEYEMVGDTDRMPARVIPGSAAEFAATRGASGTKPGNTVAVYRQGWLFARSGWGERRPYEDETSVTFRFGPGPIIHGHADAGSISLYGHGSRLIADPGKYTYNWNAYRAFFKGRAGHNVVTVDGVAWNTAPANPLINHSNSPTMVTARVRLVGNAGVAHIRGITFSRNLNYLLVEDRLSSTRTRTYRQLWHLTPDGRPYVKPTWFMTQRQRGNVQVRQLLNGSSSRVVIGREAPVQGWLAWEHGTRLKAPVVEVIQRGKTVRYLTLIVAAAGKPASGVSQLKLTKTGYSVVVKIGSKSERVVVNGSKVSITPLN